MNDDKDNLLKKDILTLVDNTNNTVPIEEKEKIVFETEIPHSEVKDSNDEEQKKKLDNLMKENKNENVEHEHKTKKENKLFFGVAIGLGGLFVVVLIVAFFAKEKIFNFNGNEVYYQNKVIENTGEYQTVVVTDNIYTGVSIKDEKDAKELIIKDANNQKSKCTNEETKKIETSIEKHYDIIATNLCELDTKFASEIENTIKLVYSEFPSIKGYLTNLTLINAPTSSYIASFLSAKVFAKANTRNTYPNVYKMSIYLNSSYFLNPNYFERSIEDCLSYGYFPNNATKTSIVAHEFGHYISFLAQLNNTKNLDSLLLLNKSNYQAYSNLINDSNNGVFSQKIINEAFDNYKKKSNKFNTVLAFRNSISEYAVEMNYSTGNYIYDETIAEAFHDYYLNRDNATDASKEIMKVLKKYLNK